MADKVGLRAGHLPKGKVWVLDCFAGSGRIWRAVKRRFPNRDIQVLAMDRRNLGFHLPGDNLTWLMQMDLSRFNVIDLDAYGVPYHQLQILFRRGYRGIVFVTFIQSLWGQMPNDLLAEIGYTEVMLEKAPALCSARGWDHFLEWLSKHGVRKIIHRSHARKHYLTFSLP